MSNERQSLPWKSSPPTVQRKTTVINSPQSGKGYNRTKGVSPEEGQFGYEGPGKASYGFILALSLEAWVPTILATGGLNSQIPRRDDVLHATTHRQYV